jgi:hypothetical protein
MGVPIAEDGALKKRRQLWVYADFDIELRPRGDEFRLPTFVVFS